MSDLRVTDVQAALRHFQSIGHDILSDTQAVHIDGKPYRLALGHQLNMGDIAKGGAWSEGQLLTSHIQQVEAPIISEMSTNTTGNRGTSPTSGRQIYNRRVSVLTPQHHPKYNDEYAEHPNYNVGSHGDFSFEPKGEFLWTPASKSQYADIHEALASHTKQDDAYQPYYNDYNHARPMTHEEYSGFNHKQALDKVLQGAPSHKGLVVVNYIKGQTRQNDDEWSKALYDINSEQLMPHDWQHPDWTK